MTASCIAACAVTSHALDVSIGGEVTTQINFDGIMFSGPEIGYGDDDEILLTMAGEGAGWNYGVSLDLLRSDMDDATVELGHAGLGQFEFSQSAINWRRDFLGDMLAVSVEFDPSHLEHFMISFDGQISQTEYEISMMNDAGRSFDAEIQFPVMGVNVYTYITGLLADTSDVWYGLELGTNVAGVDLVISVDEAATIDVSAELGAFELHTSATGGDLFGAMALEYQQEITENLELAGSIGLDGHNTTGTAAMILRF